jgi:hypothetical protein
MAEIKYKWRETFSGEGKEDYCGWNGEKQIGHIYIESEGPQKGRWHWVVQVDGAGSKHVKKTGWCPTPRAAVLAVERQYEIGKAKSAKLLAVLSFLRS